MPRGGIVLRTGCAGGHRRPCSRHGEPYRDIHAESTVALKPLDLDRLARFTTIELTTIGRRSGAPTRIEIWWFRIDDRFIITGTPGPRDWYANVVANPAVVVHVDDANVEAAAQPVDDREFRRRVFTHPDTVWYSTQVPLDDLIRTAPMVEIVFDR